MWKSETTTTKGETLTHWSFAVHFCSLRLFIYCLKMQTLLLVSLPSVSPIFFPFYTIRMRIDEIFAYWRDEYKHLINPARECVCVCVYAWPSSIIIIIIVLTVKRKIQAVLLPITESDLYPFFSYFFSLFLPLLYHPQNNETNCSRKKDACSRHSFENSLLCTFNSILSNDWQIHAENILLCIVLDHEAERWISIQSIESNKKHGRQVFTLFQIK